VSALRARAFLSRAIATRGNIVELIERTRSRSGGRGTSTMYAPVFTFTDRDGNDHTIRSTSYSYPRVAEVGEQIDIVYDPSRPEQARVNRFFSLWGLALVLAVIGSFDLVAGVVLSLVSERTERRAQES
jgi:hypothetical protein